MEDATAHIAPAKYMQDDVTAYIEDHNMHRGYTSLNRDFSIRHSACAPNIDAIAAHNTDVTSYIAHVHHA